MSYLRQRGRTIGRWHRRDTPEQCLPPVAVSQVEVSDTGDHPPSTSAKILNQVGQPRRAASVRVEAVQNQSRRLGAVPRQQHLGEIGGQGPPNLRKGPVCR